MRLCTLSISLELLVINGLLAKQNDLSHSKTYYYQNHSQDAQNSYNSTRFH